MILLFGGCGFLGKSLADRLHAHGHRLKIFDRPEAIARRSKEAPGPIYQAGDYAQIEHEGSLFEGVSAVVHLVHSTTPSTSMLDVAFDAESNIGSSIRLLDAVRRHGIPRFLFVSSGGTVYGAPPRLPVSEDAPTAPLCAYGVSKLAIEKYVQLYSRTYGVEGIIVRLANPYGPHQLAGTTVGAIANFLLRVARDEPIEIWGDGSTVRDYVYIDDVTEAMEALLVRPAVPSSLYNVGSGKGYSLQDILAVIREVCGVEPKVEYRPARSIDVPAIVLDVSRLERELNWRASVALSEGVERLWRQLRRGVASGQA
jgi:UDP-glucose 4-epimerase